MNEADQLERLAKAITERLTQARTLAKQIDDVVQNRVAVKVEPPIDSYHLPHNELPVDHDQLRALVLGGLHERRQRILDELAALEAALPADLSRLVDPPAVVSKAQH